MPRGVLSILLTLGLTALAAVGPARATQVTFSFLAPGDSVTSVAVAGTFNGWSVTATPLAREAHDRIWSAVVEIPPGDIQYKFVLNGERWVEDPTAEEHAEDGFGGRNSRAHVAGERMHLGFRGWTAALKPPPPPPPPAPEPAVEASPDEALPTRVTIFYATDRTVRDSTRVDRFYGHGRGALAYGRCEVSLPPHHRIGHLERPNWLRFDFHEDPERHVVLQRVTRQDSASFFADLRQDVASADSHQVLVFVHGYNVGFRDAALRTAQFASDLDFHVTPVLFSWPSRGSLGGYAADAASVEWAKDHLKSLLADIAATAGAGTVHVVAHSMGNRAVARALDDLARERGEAAMGMFDQVVLAAPDIDADVFRSLADNLRRTARGVTLYASSRDLALTASEILHGGFRRAGETGDHLVVVPGIETIDVSAVDVSFLGHGYVSEDRPLLADLHDLLLDGLPPGRRHGLQRVDAPGGAYWRFAP